MKEHSPNRILLSSVDLEPDCWFCYEPEKVPEEVLRAEEPWEGSAIEPKPSRNGPEYDMANALRDPYVFEDGGKLYFFYSGGGESAIGIAQLTLAPNTSPSPDTGKQ